MNQFILKLVLAMAVLVLSENAFAQITESKIVDSTLTHVMAADSTLISPIAVDSTKITIKEVNSMSTKNATVDSTSTAASASVKGPKNMEIDSTLRPEKRLKFGCGFGLSFIGGTNIGLSPNLIYAVSDKVSFGVGLQGSYAAIKDLQNTTTFGANVIAMYSPVRKLTTLLEFAELKVSTKTETPTGADTRKYWDSALFVGAGLNVTNKIAIGAKYNLLYKKDESVYTSPIIPFVNITF